MNVSVTSREHGSRMVVSVSGEVDVYTASTLREQFAHLIDAEHRDFVVDLTGLAFIDSTGLGVLVSALKRIRALDGRLHLVIDKAKVLKVFRITGLTELFTIHDSLDASLSA